MSGRGRRRGHNGWKAGTAALLAVGLVASPVGAADERPAGVDVSTSEISLAPRAAGPADVVTQAAVASGVLACASRVDQVAKFLTGGMPANFWLFMPNSARDQHIVSTSMAISTREVPLAYASAAFAPGMVDGCGAIYESVVYSPMKCTDVAAREFPTLRRGPSLGKSILSLDAGGGARVFLMPAGATGCVSIKKELL